MRKAQPPSTPGDLVARIQPFLGHSFADIARECGITVTNTKSKGFVGHFVEDLVDLPKGNDRLDYPWGDLKTKTRHLNQLLYGCVIGSLNSLASSMIDDDVSFEECVLGQKIGQTVLVTVCTNRRPGGAAGEGWQRFTLETVSSHVMRDLPQWAGMLEDWEYLKEYARGVARDGGYIASTKKGPNKYLGFNSCAGAFKYGGRNLRKAGGVQLGLLDRAVREITA